MRIGYDFWIDVLEDGSRRVCHRNGGVDGATALEAAMWDRLRSEGLVRGPPRWYHAQRARAREEYARRLDSRRRDAQ